MNYRVLLLGLLSTFAFGADKKFVVLITSYNNADWFERNLDSVFNQTYQNFRVIYIDDCSYDGNGELVEKYIHQHGQEYRTTLIKNPVRRRAMANIYYALQLCHDDEIVINHDGDDWWSDEHVLAMYNEIYQNPNVWITYGQFINWPTNKMGYCKPLDPQVVEKQLFRKKWWMPGQLRTFYAWLFKQIRLCDLLFTGPGFTGLFFPANSDLAIYYPMMEMAGLNYYFVEKVIYIRNVQTPLNDFKANKEIQVMGSKILREQKDPYARIEGPRSGWFDRFATSAADIMIFAHDAVSTQTLLDSIERLVLGYHTIYIVSAQELELKTVLPIKQMSGASKELVLSILQSAQEHLLLVDDHMRITRYVHLNECIQALERAFAYGFYLGLGLDATCSRVTGRTQPLPPLNLIQPEIYAWGHLYADAADWCCAHSSALTLYRTADLLAQWSSLPDVTPSELIAQWQEMPPDKDWIGLCFASKKGQVVLTV